MFRKSFLFGCIILLMLLFFSQQGITANFYRSTTATANFLSGTCWSTSSCGAGGLSWPTLSTDIVYIGCASKTTTIGSGGTCGDLNISNGIVDITGGTLYVWGNLNLSGGTLNITSGTLVVYGNFNKTGGTFNHSGGLVNLGGSGIQNINSNTSPLTFYNFTISSTGNRIMNTNVTTTGTLTLTGGLLTVGANTLQVGTATTGNNISYTSGKIVVQSTSNLTFGGSVVVTLSNILSTAAPWTINNLYLLRNLCTISLGGNLTVNGQFNTTSGGNLSIGAYTLTLNGIVDMNPCPSGCNNDIIGGPNSNIIIGGSGACDMYFDLATTSVGGTNTIHDFTLNRTSNTFYPLSNLRIGGTLTLAANSKFSVANGQGTLNTLTFDGTNESWTGTGEFVGSNTLTAAYMYVYGSGALSTLLKFNTTSASNYTLTGLSIDRSGSPVLQLGSNLNLLSSLTFRNSLTTYGSLDINGKVIDLGTNAIINNENSSERIFCSSCAANSTTSYINASMNLSSGTTYTGTSGPPSQTGYRGLGIDINTTIVAPGLTTIKRGFSERSGSALAQSVLRYFEILPTTNAGLDATLTFHYWDSEGNGLVEEDNGLYRDNTGSNDWADHGGISTPGSDDNTVTLSSIDQFSPWTTGKTAPLPIEILSFDAKCKSNEVIIKWKTASETNNDAFFIERSLDEENWDVIGSVKGAGNSNYIIEYSYTDEHQFNATVYYRLKQIDYNGAFKFYGPVAANCDESSYNAVVKISPNPTSSSVWLQTNIITPGRFILSDITGRTIAEYAINDLSALFNLSLKDLIPGIYLIKVESEDFSKYYKIVKQ